MIKGKIAEIYDSYQGEGIFLGEKQVFVRFFGCNFDCEFCDTNHQEYSEKTIDQGNYRTVFEIIPDNTCENLEKKTIKDELSSVFLKMPKHLSSVLHLHFIEGRPQKEIAEKEGVSVSAIKTRVHRAKKEFKKIIFDIA